MDQFSHHLSRLDIEKLITETSSSLSTLVSNIENSSFSSSPPPFSFFSFLFRLVVSFLVEEERRGRVAGRNILCECKKEQRDIYRG